jgi:hypothetical protein
MRCLRRALEKLVDAFAGSVGAAFVPYISRFIRASEAGMTFVLCSIFFERGLPNYEQDWQDVHVITLKIRLNHDRRRTLFASGSADRTNSMGALEFDNHFAILHAGTSKRNGPFVLAYAGGNA